MRFRPKTAAFLRARHTIVNTTRDGAWVTALDGRRHITRDHKADRPKTLCGRAAQIVEDVMGRPRCAACKRIQNGGK